MSNALREALARVWRWARRLSRPLADMDDVAEPGGTAAAARARFWAEVREGRREAGERAARLRS